MFTKSLVALAAVCSVGSNGFAQSLQIDSSQGVMLGSGCEFARGPSGADLQIIANGNDLSIISTGMNQSLGSFGGGPLSALKSCSIRIPMSIASGVAVKSMREVLTYGIYKSEGTAVALSVTSVIANAAPKALALKFPVGIETYIGTKSLVRRTAVDTSKCPSARSLLRVSLASSAQLEDRNEFVDLATDDGDLRYDVSLQLGSCAR